MKVSLTEKADSKRCLVLFALENEKAPAGQGGLARLIEDAKLQGFTGKPNSTTLLHPKTGNPAGQVLLAGLGKKSDLDLERLRRAAAAAVKKVKSLSQNSFTVCLPQ